MAGSEAPDAETRDSDLPEMPEESDQGSATKCSELEQVSASAASDAEPLGWAVGALVALDVVEHEVRGRRKLVPDAHRRGEGLRGRPQQRRCQRRPLCRSLPVQEYRQNGDVFRVSNQP